LEKSLRKNPAETREKHTVLVLYIQGVFVFYHRLLSPAFEVGVALRMIELNVLGSVSFHRVPGRIEWTDRVFREFQNCIPRAESNDPMKVDASLRCSRELRG
jgi:hypothetical protein